jgi:hypothetical protein
VRGAPAAPPLKRRSMRQNVSRFTFCKKHPMTADPVKPSPPGPRGALFPHGRMTDDPPVDILERWLATPTHAVAAQYRPRAAPGRSSMVCQRVPAIGAQDRPAGIRERGCLVDRLIRRMLTSGVVSHRLLPLLHLHTNRCTISNAFCSTSTIGYHIHCMCIVPVTISVQARPTLTS